MSIEGGDPYRWHEGVRAFWSDIQASFTDWLPEPEEVRDLGGVVIAEVRFGGRGNDGGVKTDQLIWQELKFHGGRISWWAIYPSEAEALEAVGLSE